MSGEGNTIECRMMCAAGCAYGIEPSGTFTPPAPFTEGVGWDSTHPPVTVFGGEHQGKNGLIDINACLVGKNQDGIIIAFRGTLPPAHTVASVLDWWQDIIDAEPKQEGSIPGKVHHGFWNAIQTLWDNIQWHVSAFEEWFPEDKLYLTGHSKGGPMASICAAQIHFDNSKMLQPDAVYTFASPHPGDADFVSGFPLASIPVTRFENYLDMVPQLPPTAEFIKAAEHVPLVGKLFAIADGWDYEPLGKLQYIEKSHKVIDDNPLLEPLRLAELVAASLKGEAGLKEIADAHSHECGGGYMSGTCRDCVC